MQQIWRLTWMTMVLAACTLMVTTGCGTRDDNTVTNWNANDNTVTNENANDNTVTNENANDNTGGAPDGFALYMDNCAGCHPGSAPALSGMPADEVIAKLEGGHHSAGLTTEEIAAVAAFVAS